MAIADDLRKWVGDTFASPWEVQETSRIPDPAKLRLNSNHAMDLNAATVLYADLDGSTDMVNTNKWQFSAEIYKTFLKCASDIIRNQGGMITAYDGDRVMGIFTGDGMNFEAAQCALRINWAVNEVIKPAMKKHWAGDFELRHVVGVDTSQLRAARIGAYGDNDIVWVGRAANYAAKLTSWGGKASRITEDVYKQLPDAGKYSQGKDMWVREYWDAQQIHTYSSTWQWSY